MITSILEYLESSASRYPDKTAFADLDATCTFEELRLRARRVGTALAEHFAPRNPVPVFMEKSVDTIGMFMESVLLELSELGAGVSWLARVRYVVYRGEGEGSDMLVLGV